MNTIHIALIAGAVGCIIGSVTGRRLVERERERWGVVHGL